MYLRTIRLSDNSYKNLIIIQKNTNFNYLDQENTFLKKKKKKKYILKREAKFGPTTIKRSGRRSAAGLPLATAAGPDHRSLST